MKHWLKYLRYRLRRIPPSKRGDVKLLGKLPYSIWVSQYIALSREPTDYSPDLNQSVSYHLVQKKFTGVLTPLKVIYYWPKYRLDFIPQRKQTYSCHPSHIGPTLKRWLPMEATIPAGMSVRMTERLGRQRAIRFMESRQRVKHLLAMEAVMDRARSCARVSKPVKTRR